MDLDLSIMPASISYAQALSMLQEPQTYAGQTMRIAGVFNYSQTRQKGVLIIADRTGCCETSIDFVCGEERTYPEDYPALYSRIVVVGRFEPASEEEAYCLADASIESM